MASFFDLTGNVAIVTGAGRGLGRAYAERLAAAGARVVVAEIDGVAAAGTARAIAAAGGEALAVATDVADDASVATMARAAVERWGRIDVLVNNAAVFFGIPRGPMEEITVDQWDRVMAVNVRGLWLCCRAVTPAMRAQGGGKIINISSDTAFSGVPAMLHYVASKGAVVALTRALARELGPDNICVNAIAPGLTMSEAGLAVDDASKQRSVAGRAIPRDEAPDDLVGTVLYLAAPASNFVTGQTLLVNGGYVLH